MNVEGPSGHANALPGDGVLPRDEALGTRRLDGPVRGAKQQSRYERAFSNGRTPLLTTKSRLGLQPAEPAF